MIELRVYVDDLKQPIPIPCSTEHEAKEEIFLMNLKGVHGLPFTLDGRKARTWYPPHEIKRITIVETSEN